MRALALQVLITGGAQLAAAAVTVTAWALPVIAVLLAAWLLLRRWTRRDEPVIGDDAPAVMPRRRRPRVVQVDDDELGEDTLIMLRGPGAETLEQMERDWRRARGDRG